MKIAFIPIDNRPVCYTLAKQIVRTNSEIQFFIPDRNLLGGLNKSADIKGLLYWLKNLPEIDSIILSLDTMTYGGLIPSRRSDKSFEEIKTNIENLKNILAEKNCKIYAFSSIMRISNNNINQEEKEYWNVWGKKIYEYSYNFHKTGSTKTDIPQDILNDYLKTRKRNFEINKLFLNWEKEGFLDILVFSKDDCAEYGINVIEANELKNLGAYIKTGADEIPLTLLARACQNPKIKVAPIFLSEKNKNLISNYEDISIEKSTKGQLELADCEITTPDNADILLYINNFEKQQGEIVMKIPTESYSKEWEVPSKPYMIADLRFANGADNEFVKTIFKKGFDKNFYGYSAWNTSANSLGSLICGGKVYFQSQLINKGLKQEFVKLQITRFLDDWAYQANVRQMLKTPDSKQCKKLMKPFEAKIFKIFNIEYKISYKFPWNRLFEVEIEFN